MPIGVPGWGHYFHRPVQLKSSKISREQLFATEADLIQGQEVGIAVGRPLERLAAGHPAVVPESS